MQPAGTHPTLEVLGSRDVRGYMVARLFGGTSHTLLRATILWQVFEITHSKFQLGVIGLIQFLPVITLSLLAGAVADRYDRRVVVMLARGAALSFSLALWITSRDAAALWVVYAMVLALATAHAFETPSGAALLPTLVPLEQFPTAVTVQATVRNLGWVTGPVLSGFAIDAGGVAAAYAIAAGLYAGSIIALVSVRQRFGTTERRAVSVEAVREGVDFVRRQPAILGSMTLDMFAVIFASVTVLLPVYAEEILRVGPRGYGLLAASIELGTVVMALGLLALPPIRRPGRALLPAVAAFGVATIVFGFSRSFALSVCALVVAGMADQVSMVARATILQLSTPDVLRGRVSAVNMVFIGASNQLGAVESGFLAAVTSATFSVVFGGFACLGVLGVIAARMPALWHYRVEADT